MTQTQHRDYFEIIEIHLFARISNDCNRTDELPDICTLVGNGGL